MWTGCLSKKYIYRAFLNNVSAFCCKCTFISPTYVCLIVCNRQFVHTNSLPHPIDCISLPPLNLHVGTRKLYRVKDRFAFSWKAFVIYNLVYVRMLNVSQLCQHNLHFNWKYQFFVVEMISSSHKNIATPASLNSNSPIHPRKKKKNAQKITNQKIN